MLPDHYLLTKDDSDVISHILGGQNFAYFYKENGPITWGAFGESFSTVGELRRIAADHPVEDAVSEPLDETVGIELFGNMLDIALRIVFVVPEETPEIQRVAHPETIVANRILVVN